MINLGILSHLVGDLDEPGEIGDNLLLFIPCLQADMQFIISIILVLKIVVFC